MEGNRITRLFNIQYPIIQAGMVWCSGWELASAVSNAGGLGLIGSGSMEPEILKTHIQKTKKATQQPFGVNVPLLKKNVDQIIDTIVSENVKIVFTSAGNPKTWTKRLKAHGIKVTHVVASSKFALKAQEAGVDAIVAEGFEAGGHNGREETTTLTLVPLIKKVTDVPLIAAGGIYSGYTMLAAMILGAEGVQMGSRFVVSEESSAHMNFKKAVLTTGEGETQLTMKKLVPVRMMKNTFYDEVAIAEASGATTAELFKLLGAGRSRQGMFEGNLVDGELEIGQASALLDKIQPAKTIIMEIVEEYSKAKSDIITHNKYRF